MKIAANFASFELLFELALGFYIFISPGVRVDSR